MHNHANLFSRRFHRNTSHVLTQVAPVCWKLYFLNKKRCKLIVINYRGSYLRRERKNYERDKGRKVLGLRIQNDSLQDIHGSFPRMPTQFT
jgi:hypothetical protein